MATNTDLSINGYYLRPSITYKADTIFGGDPELKESLAGGMKISFADLLKSGLSEVNSLQLASDDLATAFAAGETDNIHAVMIAGEKADIALQLATAVRGKLLDAYNEIMRMSL